MRASNCGRFCIPLGIPLLLAGVFLAAGGVAVAETRLDVVAAFDATAFVPTAPLVQGADGNFYGTTSAGGPSGAGTVFRLTPAGSLTILYSFTGGDDGGYPYSGLVQGTDGNLYGTTSQGGASNAGTVFQLTPAGTLNVLYAFSGTNDGAYPYAGLIQAADGNFYGTTYQGGAAGAGTVFQVTSGGTLTVLYAFTGADDGGYPYAGVIQGADGNFYGTATQGGSSSAGTIFQLTSSGTLAVVHAFTGGDDGAYPYSSLLQTSDGTLYGTASQGASGLGVVFKLTPDGTLTTAHVFAGGPADGSYPMANLIQRTDGSLYGTTLFGGSSDAGTVFELAGDGSFTLRYSFTDGDDGAYPYAALTQASDGRLYGVAAYGGAAGGGVAFRLSDVTRTPPVIRWAVPETIVYGTPLSSVQLRARANVAGTFVYDPPAGSILSTGSRTLSATFTPFDTADYTNATATVVLNVLPATPVITWTPAALVLGAPLGAAQLNATADTPGVFVYDPPAGSVLDAGTQMLSVTFVPLDTADYMATSATATVNVSVPAVSGGGNEYRLQFTPAAGARGVIVAGYALAANPVHGTIVIGNCSYYTVHSGSGRGGGYKTITTYYNQTCTWDPYGNLLTTTPGAPAVPTPIAVNGSQTIYARNDLGIYAGTDSALPGGGFVYTPGPHYTWLTSNAYAVIQQALYTFTVMLKSDGDMPLTVESVHASALAGRVTVAGTTCTGPIAVGSVCSVTVTYDPTRFRSPTGLAYDTLDIAVGSDAAQATDFAQRYTIVLSAANTTDSD